MMIRSFFFIIAFLNISFVSSKALPDDRVASKGVLDLRGIDNPDNFIVTMNGEWEFYWNQMLLPDDFKKTGRGTPYYGKVPSYWTDYPQDKVKTAKFGYATYRLTVLLPPNITKPLAIGLPVFDSSYELYLNGRKMGGNGIPGKSAAETIPEYRKSFFTESENADSLEIIINVSNFHHRRGGFWMPARLGSFEEVIKIMADSRASDISVMGILLAFSVFFLLFFILDPKEKIMAFFSIAAIGLALRPLFTSNYIINDLLNLDWVWIVRCEYLDLYLIIFGWVWFNYYLYPSRIFRIVALAVTYVYTIILILTLILPVKIFSYSMLLYYPWMALLITYPIYNSFRGTLKKRVIDTVYFMAFLLLALSGIHDIMVASGKSNSDSGYILTYTIVLFVFIQAALILYRWVQDYNERKRLQAELEFMNKNLEIIVDQRTRELKSRNEEIINQNEKIAIQNRELSDTLKLKNKVFSVIAHDLRGPVVNILYLLNLLKEKEYEDEREAFTDYSIVYAENVVRLLENMLVWGRGQESRIRYSPVSQDLTDIIKTNLSIYKEIAFKKEITVNFTHQGNMPALIDKDLVDIIIRNLLSNAIKYTPRGGSINILLTEEISDGQKVILKICDTGVGIPDDLKSKLFTSTEIVSTVGTEAEMGTGLGLKLCNELIKVSKGTISVQSRIGEGSCFIITFPPGR
jgi:signal transduction histidine kinase